MGIYQAVVDLSWTSASGSPGVNVWHMRSEDAGVPAEHLQELSDILFQFYVDCQSLYPDAVNIQMPVEIQGLLANAGETENMNPQGLSGSGGSDFLPPANCMLASWKTNSGGRHGRGRTFLGPLQSATREDNGTPDEGFRTTVQGAIDDLIESSDSFGNGALGVFSPTTGIFRDFTSGSCPNYFAVLRSRRD